MATWPPIPAWQQSDLQTLAATGKLSNVNPEILAVIDQEESGGKGGGVNSAGYGGFFGLGAGSTYPGGTSSRALLSDPSPQSFDQQAVIAASAFNAYLSQEGGDPIKAEEVYQSGSASGPTPGSKLLQQYLGGQPAGGSPAQAVTTGLNANPGDLFGIPGTIFQGLSPLIVRAGLLIFGGVLVIVALVVAARGGLSAASGATSSARSAHEQTRSDAANVRVGPRAPRAPVEEAEEVAPEAAAAA